MTTYTIINNSGAVSGYTAEEAGREFLEHDGFEWDIVCKVAADPATGERYYVLRHSRGSRAGYGGIGRMVETTHSCYAKSRAEAEAILLAEVGRAGPDGWRNCGNSWGILTDEDYAAMEAENEVA
jgi:hypothetical protein